MLIAAMVLGLIGGIAYFVGGGAGAVDPGIFIVSGATSAPTSAPWWVIALIPIGAVAIIGAALVRVNSGLGGSILLLAGAAAISVGFASFEDAANNGRLFVGPLPVHAFAGPTGWLPVPLLALIIAGALALSAGKKSDAN